MPRLMTQHQRSLCIELIPKMMSGELLKSQVREQTNLTDGAINFFRDIAKFHSYEHLVKTEGKYKEDLYDLEQTCNLVELAYATGLCDSHITVLSRKVIAGFRALVDYREKLGYPLIKGVSVASFIPNVDNKIVDPMWSTWNVNAIDEFVRKNKGNSLRDVLQAHEDMLRSDTEEHTYLDIKNVKDLKKYKDFVPQEEAHCNFNKTSSYAEQLVAIAKSSKKLNAVEIAKNLETDVGSVRCDLRFIKLHGTEEFLKYGKRCAPKRYDLETVKSLICLMGTFELSQEFVAFTYKLDRGELRRYQVNKEAKKEDFVPIFPNIPASTNIELFIKEIQKTTGLSDPFDILEFFYQKNGLSVPEYHKKDGFARYYNYLQATGVPASGETATGMPASGETATGVPASGETATGVPASGETATGVPASGETATGVPASGETATGVPASGETATGMPASGETATGVPASGETATGVPASGETATGVPASGETATANNLVEAGVYCPKGAKEHPFYIGQIDHETRESFTSADLIFTISSDSFNREVNTELPPRLFGKARRGSAMKKSVRKSVYRNKEVCNYKSEQERLLEKCGELPDKFNYKQGSKAPDTSFIALNTLVYPLAHAMFDKTAGNPEVKASSNSISVVKPAADCHSYEVVYNCTATIDCDMGGYWPCVKCAVENISLLPEELFVPHDLSGLSFMKLMPIHAKELLADTTSEEEQQTSLDADISANADTLEADNTGICDLVSETEDSQLMLRVSMLDETLRLGITSFDALKSIDDISSNPEWLKEAFKRLMGYDIGMSAEEYKAKYQGKKGRPPIVNPFSEGFCTLPTNVQESNQKHFTIAITTYMLAKEAVLKVPSRTEGQYSGDYSAILVKCYLDFTNKMKGNVNKFVARHVFDVSAGREFYMEKVRKRNELPTYKDANALSEAVVLVNIEQKKNFGANKMAAHLDKEFGIACSVKTVRKSMKVNGAMYQKQNTVQRKYDSYHGVNDNLVPNYVSRDFNPTDEWQLICTDITEVNCVEGKFYVAFWQDAFSGKILTATLSELETVEMVKSGQLEVIRMAPDGIYCLVHTDRGHQYLHLEYCKEFDNSEKFMRSVSGLGRCLDNAMIESLNGCFKEEVIARIPATELTRQRVREETAKWVEFYNFDRPNGRCNGLPPEHFLKLHRERKNQQASAPQNSQG